MAEMTTLTISNTPVDITTATPNGLGLETGKTYDVQAFTHIEAARVKVFESSTMPDASDDAHVYSSRSHIGVTPDGTSVWMWSSSGPLTLVASEVR